MEEELILSEPDEKDQLLSVIDNQLVVLSTLEGFDVELYDKATEHKLKMINRACELILKVQAKLLKEI
jgi:4-hydroxy-3-methylbut-2-enyl diphosphate reductase IspH